MYMYMTCACACNDVITKLAELTGNKALIGRFMVNI